jgi:aspartyl-tRNA(Asn)/glutamyl-tRNA(Gln) amidotransferase subunit A
MTGAAAPGPAASLARVRAAYADGSASPVDLLDQALGTIERLNDHLNAFVSVDAEGARAAALASAERWAKGLPRGPVDGCTVALKDVFDVAGTATAAGSVILADRIAAADAAVVARLRAAGAVIVGKTHSHELALGGTGENPHLGDARNPWNPERISGGSSSGSAIAVATGMSMLALGTDTGGSVRGPAALCGVVGFKPTYGLIPTDGVLPSGWSLDHVGTLTGTAADARELLGVCGNGDEQDDLTNAPAPERARLILPGHYFFEHLSGEVEAVLTGAIERLRDGGWLLPETDWPPRDTMTTADAVSWTLNSAEAAAFHESNLASQPDRFGTDVRARLELGLGLTATEYLRAQRLRRLLQLQMRDVFRRGDAILTPACVVTAFPHGAVTVDVGGTDFPAAGVLGRCFRIANLLGWPAVTVPCGLAADGLPVALQLLGPPRRDHWLLMVADRLHATLTGTEAESGHGR